MNTAQQLLSRIGASTKKPNVAKMANQAKEAYDLLHKQETQGAIEAAASQTAGLKYMPVPVTKADMHFATRGDEILPEYQDIPDEYKLEENEWNQWASNWLHKGADFYPVPKPGIHAMLALNNLVVAIRDATVDKKRVVAGVAYLGALWFEHWKGKPINKGE